MSTLPAVGGIIVECANRFSITIGASNACNARTRLTDLTYIAFVSTLPAVGGVIHKVWCEASTLGGATARTTGTAINTFKSALRAVVGISGCVNGFPITIGISRACNARARLTDLPYIAFVSTLPAIGGVIH